MPPSTSSKHRSNHSASAKMMANSSLSSSFNLSGQSLDLLRWALCEHQQTSSTGQALLQQSPPDPTMQIYLSNNLQHDNRQPLSDELIPNEHPVTKFVVKHLWKPMNSLDTSLDYYSSGFWQNSGDQRTGSLPFMSGGPWKLLYATTIYLYLVKIVLPRAMNKLPALELNWPLRGYNLLMIVSNIYAFYHGCRLLDFGRKCFGCEVIDHQDYSHAEMELLNYGWLFLLSRLVEWLDTIFFVLRKKENQVTKLHVFHHSFVPLICWTYLKYHPGKTVAFFPLVNTFVHSIMYTYYFLATFGRSIQPYLWWKKYLTSLQIIQFVLILVQLATIPLSSNEKCQYPRGFLYVAFAGAILFLWLFYTYYIETYKTARPMKHHQLGPSTKSKQNDEQRQQLNSKLIEGLHRRRLNSDREGTSRALSESIENAIGSDSGPFLTASGR